MSAELVYGALSLVRSRSSTKRSWPALVLFGGGLLLLASLYLPWQSPASSSCSEQGYFGNQGDTVCGLLNLFSGGRTIDGLSSEVGRAAALFGLLLVALAAAAWIRPRLASRLPLGRCALLAGYFGVAVGAQTRSDADQQGVDETLHYASGAYVGLAAVIVVLVAAGVERREELARYRSLSRLVMLVLVGGLLAAFLLPWWEQEYFGADNEVVATFTTPGIASAAAAVAAALALCLPVLWSRVGATLAERLGLAAAIVLFTGGASVSLEPFFGDRALGVWVALGLAGSLLLFALVDGPRSVRLAQSSWRQLSAAGAGALFLAALFLPWQSWCYDANQGFGPLGGHCLSTNAWSLSMPAAAASLLAIALVVAVLQPRRHLSVVELAAGFGLLVATIGFSLQEGGGGGFHVGHAYGSTIGFTLATGLIVLALARSRLPTLDWRRAAVRLVPIAACAAYLTIIVLPLWDVFQEDFHTPPIYPPLSWLTIAGALLGIHLLGLWARQIAGASGGAELVLVPLALLALATVDLINQRAEAATWGRGAVVSVCLLLALLGRIEQREGLESFRIPGALRVDRL